MIKKFLFGLVIIFTCFFSVTTVLACATDYNCPVGQMCDKKTKACYAGTGSCVRDKQCASGVCSNGICATGNYGLDATAKSSGYNPGSSSETLVARANQVINFALSLVAVIFFVMALYAGIRWITARGKEELAEKALNALEAAIIGLVIVAASYALSNFVISRLYSSGGGDATTSDACSVPVEDGSGCCTGLSTGLGGNNSYCRGVNTVEDCTMGNFVSKKCECVPGCTSSY